MNPFPWLTALTVAPLIGALVILCLGATGKHLARGVAFVFSLLALVIAAALWLKFDSASGDLQFVERNKWIPSIAVEYFVGVDGLG